MRNRGRRRSHCQSIPNLLSHYWQAALALPSCTRQEEAQENLRNLNDKQPLKEIGLFALSEALCAQQSRQPMTDEHSTAANSAAYEAARRRPSYSQSQLDHNTNSTTTVRTSTTARHCTQHRRESQLHQDDVQQRISESTSFPDTLNPCSRTTNPRPRGG